MKKKIIVAWVIVLSLLSGMIWSEDSHVMAKTVKIKLNYSKKRLVKGKKVKIKVKKIPLSNKKQKIIWKSGNKKVASVTQKGVVRAKRAGKTTIKAYVKGNKKVCGKCVITVVNKKTVRPEPSNTKPSDWPNMSGPSGVVPPTPTGTPDTSNPTGTMTSAPAPTDTPNPADSTESPNFPTESPADPTESPSSPTESPTGKPEKETYVVTFIDSDGSIIAETMVLHGEEAVPPEAPKHIGYVFKGWDKDFSCITKDIVIQAVYEKDMAPAVIVGDVTAKAGQKNVEVPVYINANPGILGMTLSLQFDDEKLKLKEAENGDAVKEKLVLTCGKELKNNCKFTWDGQEIEESDIKDGTIIVFHFELSDETPIGEYNINLYYQDGDIVDKDLQPIALELRGGKITVKED